MTQHRFLLLALLDCHFLLAPLADLQQRVLGISSCQPLHLLHIRGCWLLLPTSGNVPKSWTREATGSLHSVQVSYQTRPTGCSRCDRSRTTHFLHRKFQSRACIRRNVIQAPPQLYSLLYFRFHHKLELHDLVLDLDSRLEVPHNLNRVRLMPPPRVFCKVEGPPSRISKKWCWIVVPKF